VDETLREELVAMWMAEQALPSREAALERAGEAAVVARDSAGRLIGVGTLKEVYAPRLINHFFQYRSFVARDCRRQDVGTKVVSAVTTYLEDEFAAGRIARAIGLLSVVENPHLQAGLKDAITILVPFIFVGVTEEGKQIRVYYFKGAKIVRD
jgi:GNAT superfamily N-acetyltransferase